MTALDSQIPFSYGSIPGATDAEREFAVWAMRQGWEVTKRGWPDFLCRRGEEVMCVEVKTGPDHLSHFQVAAAHDLCARGIPCFEWRPPNPYDPTDGALKPIFDTDRLMTEEDLSLRAASDRLSSLNRQLMMTREAALGDATKWRSKHAALKAEAKKRISELEDAAARLRDDVGYLLRQFSDSRYQPVRVRRMARKYRQERATELHWTLENEPFLAKPCGVGWPG